MIWIASRTKPSACNKSVLRKTDSMQTILSSAKSVFSLCGRYCPNHLQRCFPADENQMKNRSAHDL